MNGEYGSQKKFNETEDQIDIDLYIKCQNEKNDLKNQLEVILDSKAWKFISLYRILIKRFFPDQSLRRRFYNAVVELPLSISI